MAINVTYAITVCNEHEEIIKLVNFLHPRIKKDDEILIQYDEDSVTQQVKDYLNVIQQLHSSNVKVIGFPLNNDFSSYKNNLKNHAKGIFIFQIDADEIPSEYMVENLSDFLLANKDVDLFFVPRINTVEGLTQEHIKKWGWQVNEHGWVNFPDYQWRIWKNKPEIKWVNKVHERLDGFKTYSALPAESSFCLYHPKDIARQERQNSYYETL